jgi:hypothetical protein
MGVCYIIYVVGGPLFTGKREYWGFEKMEVGKYKWKEWVEEGVKKKEEEKGGEGGGGERREGGEGREREERRRRRRRTG